MENHPLKLPPFNCTVLYKNVLNVLVLGTFFVMYLCYTELFPVQNAPLFYLEGLFNLRRIFFFLSVANSVLLIIPLTSSPLMRKSQ